MADELNLEEIKLKDREEMTPDEEKFLTENWNDLDDEDRDVLADLNPKKEEEKEGEKEEETEEKEEEKEEEITEEAKEEEAKEELKGIHFDSEDDFEAAVDKIIAKKKAEEIQVKEEAEQKEKEDKERFTPEDWKPKDWEEAAQSLYPKFKERVIKDLREASSSEKKRLSEINKQFDDEIEGIRKSGEPIPEAGTTEREALDKELAEIGLRYG